MYISDRLFGGYLRLPSVSSQRVPAASMQARSVAGGAGRFGVTAAIYINGRTDGDWAVNSGRFYPFVLIHESCASVGIFSIFTPSQTRVRVVWGSKYTEAASLTLTCRKMTPRLWNLSTYRPPSGQHVSDSKVCSTCTLRRVREPGYLLRSTSTRRGGGRVCVCLRNPRQNFSTVPCRVPSSITSPPRSGKSEEAICRKLPALEAISRDLVMPHTVSIVSINGAPTQALQEVSRNAGWDTKP